MFWRYRPPRTRQTSRSRCRCPHVLESRTLDQMRARDSSISMRRLGGTLSFSTSAGGDDPALLVIGVARKSANRRQSGSTSACATVRISGERAPPSASSERHSSITVGVSQRTSASVPSNPATRYPNSPGPQVAQRRIVLPRRAQQIVRLPLASPSNLPGRRTLARLVQATQREPQRTSKLPAAGEP